MGSFAVGSHATWCHAMPKGFFGKFDFNLLSDVASVNQTVSLGARCEGGAEA